MQQFSHLTVGDLIEILQEFNPEHEVRLATQPMSPRAGAWQTFAVEVEEIVWLAELDEFGPLPDDVRREFTRVGDAVLRSMMPPPPILVRWYWPSCDLAADQSTFVVAIPIERMAEVDDARPEQDVSEYLARVEELATAMPGSVTEGHVTCLVAATGDVIRTYENPAMPYSGMWNAYNPLHPVNVCIDDLSELSYVGRSMPEIANVRE